MATNLPGQDTIARYAFPWLVGSSRTPATRHELYETLEGYYFNTIMERLGLAALDPDLAANAATESLRGVYNPATAIVDCYVEWCLSGKLGAATDPEAKVTVASDNPAVEPAVLAIWEWSRLEQNKGLLPFYAANYGDALLLVGGRPDAQQAPGKVWVEVRHPGLVTDVDYDDRDNLVYARLEEFREEPRTVDDALAEFGGTALTPGRSYRWTGVYTKREFATFRDGKPWDYRAGTEGGKWRWPNPWGFVPMVLVQQKRSGGDWGLNAYHAAIPGINELCLDGSVVGQLLGQWLAPQWALFGVGNSPNAVKRTGNVWKVPDNGRAEALVAAVDFAGAYEHIGALMKWLADRQPELALGRAREANLQTGAAIRAMLFETVKKLETAEDAYDDGLVRSLQMAMTVGQTINPGTRPLRALGAVGSYADGELAFMFDRPDVLPVSELEAAQAEAAQAEATRSTALQKLITPAQNANGSAGVGGGDAAQTAASLLAGRLLNGAGVP